MRHQSGSSHFRARFESAYQDYENTTDITLATHPLAKQLKNCHSVESITAVLQDQARALRGFQDVVKTIRSIVSHLCLLSGTSAFGDAIGLPLLPSEAVYASLAILLAAAKDMSTSYTALVHVLESIERFLEHLNIYTKIPSTPAMNDMVAKIIVELLATLALATKELRQGRPMNSVMKFLEEKDVEAALQRLSRLNQDEARMVSFQILEVIHCLVQNMRVVMGDGYASIDSHLEVLGTLQQMVGNKNKTKSVLQQEIWRWLSPPDPWKFHNVTRGLRHGDTGAWFLRSYAFSKWKWSGQSPLLWVHGKPGAGKSVLCSTIIEEIEAMRKSGLASLAFFYFDSRDDRRNDLHGLLFSLLARLCDQSDSYCDTLQTFYLTTIRGIWNPSDDELIQCLQDILRVPGQAPVYLIMDALDECRNTLMLSSRENVLMFLKTLIDSRLPNLRICVTSRPEADIMFFLEPLTFRSISLHDESGHIGDIQNFIKSVAYTNKKMKNWKLKDTKLVVDILTERADGMFQWVHCQLEYLRNRDRRHIRHALYELPETLDATYERILRDIGDTNWKIARRLFSCVAVASRPLLVEELAEIFAFDFDTELIPTFREDWRKEDPLRAVLSICGSLLVLVNIDGSQGIQFSHFSAKDFLTSRRLAEKRLSTYRRHYISMTSAHTLLARACLGIILHLDHSVTRDSLPRFPLAEYAGKHWTDHAQVEGVLQNIDKGIKQLFDPGEPHFAVWIWLYDPADPFWTPDKRGKGPSHPSGTPLHYATLCGLQTMVKFLVIERIQAVLSRGFSDFLTPLHVAYTRGLVEAACILLENGADESAPDWHGWSPLHLALSEGHLEFARIFLGHNTRTTAQDEDNSTPLHQAASKGNMELARLFLAYDASVTALDRHGCGPLHLASGGHLESAQILLKGGADATARDRYGWTPLHLASSGGHIELVRILLQYGADVTAQDRNDWTSLHRASSKGHTDIVRLLLEHGADADARDNDDYSPLHRASQLGHVEAVRVLLEYGADVDAEDLSGWTSLHVASQHGHLEVVQVLLERGANVHALDYGGWTALQLPSQNGDLGVVRVLLEHGADANTRDNSSWTPLHGASQQGHLEVVRMLLEHGADANSRDDSNQTSLHLASGRGHLETAQLLVEYSANINLRTEKDRTAFQEASIAGHDSVMQLLLEHGAEEVVE